jgi:hypothetical protein
VLRTGVLSAAFAAVLILTTSIGSAGAVESLPLPFAGGQAVRIVQGYNGGTHQGRSGYALDLVLAAGATSGVEVLSPIDGVVVWAFAPGTGNGCMGIAMRDGSYSVTLCHVIFERAFKWREGIARGQVLGTVGPPGTVGNNGTAHVHLELHRGSGARSPVPFAASDGLLLEGVELALSGARNEHALRPALVSSNAAGSGAAAPAPRAPAPPPPAAAPAPAPAPARLAAAAVAPPARTAIVSGTDACLKIRKEPSLEAAVVDCLPDGTSVPLTAATQRAHDYQWREIADRGWAVADYLQPTRAVVSGTDSCLNVRESPSTTARVLRCLREGTSVDLTRESTDGWLQLKPSPAEEQPGWVLGEFLD